MQVSIQIFQILKPLIKFIFLALLILFLCRVGLMIWQLHRVESIETVLTILLNGLRIDLSTLAYLLIIPALIHPLLCCSKYYAIWLKVLRFWFLLCLLILTFFELATPTFIQEYDLRPNRLFIEYLIYPKEVFSMLVQGHTFALVLTIISLIVCVFLYRLILSNFVFSRQKDIRQQRRQLIRFESKVVTLVSVAISICIIVISLFGLARGTLGHRPLNPSVVYFSTDPLINSLTLNSLYSVAFAFKQLGGETHAANVYGKLSDEEVINIVRSSSELDSADFNSSALPTLHRQVPEHSYNNMPKNLVIILEESLGARFVSHLGGKKITPNIDELMQEGWAFNQLYATGTRSVRGIEAILTGFTPTPARSVVKLDKSQRNFFTIAELLKRKGYVTQFIYGGESHFDNMKSFFLGNGFTDIVDFDDIQDPGFVASWGACDESLFNQAHRELTQLSDSGKPFFSLVFTSSNHDPFDIPDNKVPVIEGEDARDRAIRFADYALGNFIKTAKQSNYWDDTIFLVIADHDARVYGPELVPIKSFHIPGVILGKDIPTRQDNRIVSQIDMAPTLLSLMGIEGKHPMLGFDLNKQNQSERAMMQFDKNFAYMVNNQVAILQPHKTPMYFTYDHRTQTLSSSQSNEVLGKQALGHALFGSKAYDKQWYTLESE